MNNSNISSYEECVLANVTHYISLPSKKTFETVEQASSYADDFGEVLYAVDCFNRPVLLRG